MSINNDKFDLKGFLKSKSLLKENKNPDWVSDSSGPNKLDHKWDNLEDEMKWELLLTACKDPDEAEHYIDKKWSDLPPEIQSNIDWSKESEGQELDEMFKDENQTYKAEAFKAFKAVVDEYPIIKDFIDEFIEKI
jgi:hypothetical protein